MANIGVDCVRSSSDFDFKNLVDDTNTDDGLYNNSNHNCA